jgi:hypothetical protein
MEEQAFNTSEKMTRTPLSRMREIRRLHGILSQQSFELEQIFGDVHKRRLVVAAKELGEDSEQLIKALATQIVGLPGFKGASAEKVYDAVAAKMEQLEIQLAQEQSRINSASGGNGEPPGSHSTAADVRPGALAAAREALRGEDPDEMNGVHQQLSSRVEEMETAAADLDGELFSRANELLRESESTLRKLWKRKQEIERGSRADGGSPSGNQSPQNRRSDFSLPAGVQLTVTQCPTCCRYWPEAIASCLLHHGPSLMIATEAITCLRKSCQHISKTTVTVLAREVWQSRSRNTVCPRGQPTT